MGILFHLLGHRVILILMFIINFFGTAYGYVWYGSQLQRTPSKFLAFVPDSPTASLFFVFVLIAFLLKKNWPLMESLAMITLFKYGIWAVVMNLLVFKVTGELSPVGWMLVFSHLGMAIQGLLYAPYYRMKIWHIIVAAIWTLHNDVIDYVFFMYPSYPVLSDFVPQIGYFTFWLSLLSILLAYWLGIRKRNIKLNLPL